MEPAAEQISLSLIVPTLGRPTLARTLRSIQSQVLYSGDELLLVADGNEAAERTHAVWRGFRLPGRLISLDGDCHHDWGNTARRRALAEVNPDPRRVVCYLDDDDAYPPGALAIVRRAVQVQPGAMHLFRMQYASGRSVGKCLWSVPQLLPDNVGTPMFVHPAVCRFGDWGRGYRSDFDFIGSTIANHPESEVCWHRDVIAWIRPLADGSIPSSP